MEGLSDESENSKIIEISDASPAFDERRLPANDQDTRIEQVMASTGALSLIGSDDALAEQITRETMSKLWGEVHVDESKADEVLAKVKAGSSKNPFRAQIAAQFEADLDRVRNAPLPEGYNPVSTLPDGTVVDMTPTLAQRRFALTVKEQRVHANWSGTGAGKTLGGVLSVAETGAQETLVVCPAGNVVLQWKREFERAFPGTEVRTDLPKPGEDLDATRDGRRRVWVLNYDKFSGKPEKGQPTPADLMGPLAERLDASIIDEVHKAKATKSADESTRRRVLNGILDKARENNEDLVVVPTTATPVVTGLEEAKSILRMAYGKAPAGMGTTPTLKNAAFAYQALSAAGTRVMPAYTPTLTRNEDRVDITDNLPTVLNRMDALAEKHVAKKKAEYDALPETEKRHRKAFDAESVRKRALSHPSTMERALLPERLPAIVNKVKAADGPTVVYSEYTTGVIDPIVDRLRSEGITAAQYTGKESTAERADLIRKFQNGEIKVLVGSKSIGTGVDGLQRVSKKMIVASMPWTAADDDQMVGRLHRTGQTENVTIDYVMTEVDLGGGQKWSYCKGRKNRIEFRKSLADAAVDGKMPAGQLGSENAQVALAVEKMRAAVAARTTDYATAA
jgi:superfamily II DNA or RNA helicase